MPQRPTDASRWLEPDHRQDMLDFYAKPSAMTSGGAYAAMFDPLPRDVAALSRVVQGLAIHEYAASPFYGVAIPEERRQESHIRPVERMVERILVLDPRPLAATRPPEKRLIGVCHHFALLHVAALRAKGVPARARWGLGAYFNPGFFEDHVLCEYWNATQARWVLVDPQLDEIWQTNLKTDFDALDVPRDQFLLAHDAWIRCRTGKADATRFGIFKGNLRGLLFIACELIKDVAALNKVETLPWDVWGAMPRPDEQLHGDHLAFFDRLAELTREGDKSYGEIRTLYDGDDRLRVPGTVFNALLQRQEAI